MPWLSRLRLGRLPSVVLSIVGLLLFIGLAAVILTVISGLTALPSTVLTSPACPAPCWYDIRPGQTKVGTVLGILDAQPFVRGSSVRVWPASGDINQIAWFFQRPAPDTAGYAYFDSEQCTALSITTQGTLNIGQALSKFGQPERIFTQTGQEGLRAWVEVDLVYPAAGYVVEADLDAPAKSDPPQVTIRQQTSVMRVTYFDPQRFQALLANSTIIHGPANLSQSALQPWPGLDKAISYTRP